MSRNTKRKHDDFDPAKSDSEDGDYDNKVATHRARGKKPSRPQPRSQKSQKRRRTYHDSEDDIVDDDEEVSVDDSFSESEAHADSPEISSTGRRQRAAAKKQVNYEESEDEVGESDSDNNTSNPSPAKGTKSSRPQVTKLVKLHISPAKMRALRSRKLSDKGEPTPDATNTGTRRSSRISRASEEPLVELTTSGRHTTVVRPGSRQSSEEPSHRATRGGKSVGTAKKFPSVIQEASEEGSGPTERVTDPDSASFLDELQENADAGDVAMVSDVVATPDDNEEIVMGSEGGDELAADTMRDGAVQGVDEDEDDEPVLRRPSRGLRQRVEHESPPKSSRSLRPRKAPGEASSDFEPEAEDDGEENISNDDDELSRPAKRKAKSDDSDSGGGRRSGRLAARAKSQAQSESEDGELDIDELADEAADLAEDRRRNKRPRRGRRVDEMIAHEPSLRKRSKAVDYRVYRPELAAQLDEFEANMDSVPSASQGRGSTRRPGAAFRSLFSTAGPFGGTGESRGVFGAPTSNAAAAGADSDSSDDDAIRRPSAAIGGAVGMTPTQGQLPFGGLVPQTHNQDPAQGGPANFGKVKDKKALADADPLGVDPNVNFDAVGGLGDHIDRLKEMVALPLLYPEIFMRMHVTPPRGVLFHGPPGTGKTLLARALASSVSSGGKKVTFYMRKGADALSKWVGEAERQLRLLFEEARKNQPSIIFFDEIDGLAPVRSSKQEQIHASIVATLLALMDGMDGRGQVIVIGATNRPDSVDPALRRPGRFDREFYFPLPNKEARRAILDIHTKGWEPALTSSFKDQLAELTKGYGGADLRSLCTEAALNAVQGTFPQIYSSNKKLLIDPSEIKVLAKDFMISVNKIVPSSERSASSGAAPLKKSVEPLLRSSLAEIEAMLGDLMPKTKQRTALEEAEYDDRDDVLGFEKENLQRDFESSHVFRPRLLITGNPGMGQQYLSAALLHKFEGMYVANFDLSTIFKDSSRSPEAAIVQMFEEVKRHKPSVIYIMNVDIWYHSLTETTIRTFTGLLRTLNPSDPVLLLGVMENAQPNRINAAMMRDLFGYSQQNTYILQQPHKHARQEYFASIIEYIQKPPSEFPDPEGRKKRILPVLLEAPAVQEVVSEPTKAERKAQRKRDNITLSHLKIYLQQIMDWLKKDKRKFLKPPIDPRLFEYLVHEQDPELLTTDLDDEEARMHMDRPYRLDKDHKGVVGIREVVSDRFFYNLELSTMEDRLSNGYYKRPKDFLFDVKCLLKDARTLQDQDRLMKAKEILTAVEVDLAKLQADQPLLWNECEAIFERDKARAEKKQSEAAALQQPVLQPLPSNITVDNLPWSSAAPRQSHPLIDLQVVPRGPITPQKSDLSNVYSQSNGNGQPQSNGSGPHHHSGDVEMGNSHDTSGGPNRETQYSTPAQGTLTQKSQHSSIMQIPLASQAKDYVNSASTTTSGHRTGEQSARSRSDRSSGHTGNSNGGRFRDGDVDFSAIPPPGGSQLTNTQEPNSIKTPESSPSNQVQPAITSAMGPPASIPKHHAQQQQQQQTQQGGVPVEHAEGAAGERRSSASDATHKADISALLNAPLTPKPSSDNAGHPALPSQPAPAPAPASAVAAPSTFSLQQQQQQQRRLIPVRQEVITLLSQGLVDKSSGLSVEQLEQVKAQLMKAIWATRREWNRDTVCRAVLAAFNATLEDIESVQEVLKPSQPLFHSQGGGGPGEEGDGVGDDFGANVRGELVTIAGYGRGRVAAASPSAVGRQGGGDGGDGMVDTVLGTMLASAPEREMGSWS